MIKLAKCALGEVKPETIGNLRTTTTTLSTTTGSEIPCTAQARLTNFVIVVSSTTPNTVESHRPAVHKPINSFALSLASKHRLKATRKWPSNRH